MTEITKDLIIKKMVKPYSEKINSFFYWKRKPIFPEVLEALMGKSEEHDVWNIAPDLVAVKRKGYQRPHFFVDTTNALVYCQFWEHNPRVELYTVSSGNITQE